MDSPSLATTLSSHYRIERELGAGGMATVYLARDLKHDRDVAIKVLHPDLAESLGKLLMKSGTVSGGGRPREFPFSR